MRREQTVGIVLIILSVTTIWMFYSVQQDLSLAADTVLDSGAECVTDQGCLHEKASNWLLIGSIPATIIAAIGVYLSFFFEVSAYKVSRSKDEQFSLILKGLSAEQQEAMKAIREDDGVTQSTLKYRVSMSKSKLSQTLSELEERNLISRSPDGKTKRIHLKI